MDPRLIFVVFLVVGGGYTLIWAWIVATSRKNIEYSAIGNNLAKLRRRLAFITVSAAIVVFSTTILLVPYEPVKTFELGKPQIAVTVVASQYFWNFSQYTVPSGVLLEFDVTSIDVNHGFGIYTPDMVLYAQVQAMPGYVNKLLVVFDKPGRYLIHCLEYCGPDHSAMVGLLDVT